MIHPDVIEQVKIDLPELELLFGKLQSLGFQNIGPVARDGAIMLDRLDSFEQLAIGYREKQGKGSYHVEQQVGAGVFEYSVGPQSFKQFLHPPRRKMWSASKKDGHFHVELADEPPKMAFWGVRSCDLAAISILDRVFLQGSVVNKWYQQARDQLFVIAVGCTHPSDNCFCTSMGTGPQPVEGYDISMVEVCRRDQHYFVSHIATERASALLESSTLSLAGKDETTIAECRMRTAAAQMPRRFKPEDAREILQKNLDHQYWAEIGQRCLSCANCTMVCPTCFCTTTEDIVDLTGDHTERWLRWDSCFTGAFSFIHGGQIRDSTSSRYRQWMTHKLSHWHDQFGSSGCVGCGRCIAWCPVGIDITEGLSSLSERGKTESENKKLSI